MIPSAAPYSVTWNAERQVTTQSPLIERAFLCLGFAVLQPHQPVAHLQFGNKVLRLRRIHLQLLPQMRHMHP